MIKKFLLSTCIICSLLISLLSVNAVAAHADTSAEIAMELTTESVIEEKNADLRLPMASTTKIMTAIIIIEDCNLEEVIEVADEAVGAEGSSIYLKKGEKISVKDLLYGLMLRSGNDSAAALAIHHSGSIDKFAVAMNKKAIELGLENTNFTNPSGLPDDEHYTTARELCKIACYAMRNKVFKEIVSAKTYSGDFRSYTNKNKMLFNYEGANGVKTGYTIKAGRCLVTSAEREGMDVVCVVLNCPNMYERSEEILNRAFADYNLIKIDENKVFMSGEVLCKISKCINILAKKNENIEFRVNSIGKLKNIEIGDLVGKLEIIGQNGLILCENLYSIIGR